MSDTLLIVDQSKLVVALDITLIFYVIISFAFLIANLRCDLLVGVVYLNTKHHRAAFKVTIVIKLRD